MQLVPYEIAPSMERLLASPRCQKRLEEWIREPGAAETTIASVTLEPPLRRPGKIVGVGNNYSAHVVEAGLELPAEPIVFAKFASSIVGHDAPIVLDCSVSDQVDFEAELAVVMGRTARRVQVDAAMDYVFGYTCANDVSARDLQTKDGQWVRAKSLDSFCPLGPWIVTADEIPDPGDLAITSVLAGTVMQSSSTRLMIYGVASLISAMSHWFTLEPGDVICTGTPAGVGAFRDPPRFLRDGDRVDVWIERIGTLSNPVVAVS